MLLNSPFCSLLRLPSSFFLYPFYFLLLPSSFSLAGWRIEIKSLPRLVSVGSWRMELEINDDGTTQERKVGGHYTQDDVREIVAYVRRGEKRRGERDNTLCAMCGVWCAVCCVPNTGMTVCMTLLLPLPP